MGNTKYTYAVARIRALETSLLTNAVIEQLLACPTAEQALQLLIEKGWGDGAAGNDMDAVLNREEEKTWQVIRDVAPDMSVFDVLSYPKLYHNLKAAVKEVCTEVRNPHIFLRRLLHPRGGDAENRGKQGIFTSPGKYAGRRAGSL